MLLPHKCNQQYAHQMPIISHMCQFLDMHQLTKYNNIYGKCELATINDVTRNAMHRCWTMLTLMLPDNNDDDSDATIQLHWLSWPLDQISQK